MNKKIKLLVCICTQNRKKKLGRLLKSLNNLLKINDIYLNIIVVENELKSRLNKSKFFYRNVRSIKFFLEENIGISFARNRCLHEAKKINFDYMVFFDDDCIVDKRWLIENLNFIKEYNCDIITGPHQSKNNLYINLIERKFERGKSLNWASTNNVIFKKNLLNKEKPKFDLNIQKIGGEDQLFFMELKKKGYKILWNNLSIVYEESSKKRNNFIWFIKRSFGYGCSSFYIYKNLFKKTYFFILIISIFYNFFKMIINCLRLPFSPKSSILKIFHFIFKIFGILSVTFFSYEIKRY